MAFLDDSMTEGSTVNLTAHTPEIGGAWAKHVNFSADMNVIGGGGYAIGATASSAIYLNDMNPPSADYYVEGLIDRDASGADVHAGVLGRASNSATTFYQAYYNAATGLWWLEKVVAGVTTQFGNHASALVSGSSRTLRLEMIGTAIKMYVGGTERVSVVDSSITAAGFAGTRARQDGRILSVTAEDLGAGAPPGRLLGGLLNGGRLVGGRLAR